MLTRALLVVVYKKNQNNNPQTKQKKKNPSKQKTTKPHNFNLGQFSHSPLLSFSKVCWLSVLPSCQLWPSELSSLCSLQPAKQTRRACVPEHFQHWSLLVNGAVNTHWGFAVWWCLVWAQRSPLHTWASEGLLHRNSWVWTAGFGHISFGLWTDFQGSSTPRIHSWDTAHCFLSVFESLASKLQNSWTRQAEPFLIFVKHCGFP